MNSPKLRSNVTWRALVLRLTVFMAAPAAISGCTVMMAEPVRPTVAQLSGGVPYADAYAYLERARTAMNVGLAQVAQLDTVTRIGVGVGVGGAAISTLAKGRPDVTLGLLGLGGIGYSVAQTSAIPGQRDVYGAGIDSLDCIAKTGRQVNRETGTARRELERRHPLLAAAIAALVADLDELDRQFPQEAMAMAIAPDAHQALRAATTLGSSITAFINATEVGSEMTDGVDRTVRAVNTQLKARAPNLDEIAKAGTIFTGFVTAHAAAAADAQATKAAAKTTALSTAAHPLADKIQRHLRALRDIAADMQPLLPQTGYATSQLLDICKAQVPGQRTFRVKPDAPIRLTAGGDAYGLSVESEVAVAHDFHGPRPTATQLIVSQPSERTFSVAAPAGAKAGKYQLYIFQKNGRELPDIEVTVDAAPAPVPGATSAPRVSAGSAKSGNLTFAAKLKLLGLKLGEAQSEDDMAFKGRVQKLENCVGLPSTGVLGDKLIAELNLRNPVQEQGDCTARKAVPGAAGGAPIPKPPKLGASN